METTTTTTTTTKDEQLVELWSSELSRSIVSEALEQVAGAQGGHKDEHSSQADRLLQLLLNKINHHHQHHHQPSCLASQLVSGLLKCNCNNSNWAPSGPPSPCPHCAGHPNSRPQVLAARLSENNTTADNQYSCCGCNHLDYYIRQLTSWSPDRKWPSNNNDNNLPAPCMTKCCQLRVKTTLPAATTTATDLIDGPISGRGGQQSPANKLQNDDDHQHQHQHQHQQHQEKEKEVDEGEQVNGGRVWQEQLAELRLERCKLQGQIEKLSEILTKLSSQVVVVMGQTNNDNDNNNNDNVNVNVVQSTTTTTTRNLGKAANCPLAPPVSSSARVGAASNAANQQPMATARTLSSNIQRMKRMDTLKRRKMKREQQKSINSSSGDSAANLPALEEANSCASIRFARPLAEDIRQQQEQVNCDQVIAENSSEEEEEDNDDSQDSQRGRQRPTATKRTTTTTPPGGDISKQPQTRHPQYKPLIQNYQNLRNSLANLMNEAVNLQTLQQQQREQRQRTGNEANNENEKTPSKKRFSFSAFSSSFSAALSSPFGTPKKLVQMSAARQTPEPPEQVVHESRKASSSRSQSSSSGAGNLTCGSISARASPRPAGAPHQSSAAAPTASNNCSCLKSSGSSQSVDSMR